MLLLRFMTVTHLLPSHWILCFLFCHTNPLHLLSHCIHNSPLPVSLPSSSTISVVVLSLLINGTSSSRCYPGIPWSSIEISYLMFCTFDFSRMAFLTDPSLFNLGLRLDLALIIHWPVAPYTINTLNTISICQSNLVTRLWGFGFNIQHCAKVTAHFFLFSSKER